MAKVTGLGRGLGSLIPNKKIAEDVISETNHDIVVANKGARLFEIPVEDIQVNPHQPRQVFDHEGLEELINSIKVYGIIQPLIVTKMGDGYQLIAGERRLRSAKIIGLHTVPAIIREAKEQEKLELALIENIQRRNLNAIEKAIAYQRLIDEFSLTQEKAADKLGVNRSTLANIIRFLDLPEQVQKALAENKITEGHAKVIASFSNEKEQLEFLDKVLNYNFTVRDAERESRKTKTIKNPVTKKTKSIEQEEKEDLLRKYLNTKVNIKSQGGEGQIVIEFYSDAELNSIINQIIK